MCVYLVQRITKAFIAAALSLPQAMRELSLAKLQLAPGINWLETSTFASSAHLHHPAMLLECAFSVTAVGLFGFRKKWQSILHSRLSVTAKVKLDL